MRKKLKVDICCGNHKPKGFIGVDTVKIEGVDKVCNLNDGFPFKDNSVDYLRAHDAIEHLADKIKTMNEIWRVCKNGATVDIKVPSTDGRGAFQDPTHISYWNMNSFFYYSSKFTNYHDLCKRYGFKGDFIINQLYDISTGSGVIHTCVLLTAKK